jgi:hypothetical protein
VIYEGGNKRYNDETFSFHGHNGAVVLENGGGKTVFIQTAIQAVLPHSDLAGRKVKDTLMLDQGPAHIAIEWILNDKPRRRYALTCVSLFQNGTGIDSYRYVYEYGEHDNNEIDQIPFVKENVNKPRSADKGEMQDYYSSMEQRYPLHAKTFPTIKEYKAYLEQQFQIISGEWEAIVTINDTEGGIEGFFDECKTTTQLFDRLLIPTVERSIEGYEQGSFAKMFEDHREGFEKYKQLKEQIDENQKILQELGGYVRLFEQLDRVGKQYDIIRSDAKAYWNLTVNQQKELEAERNQLMLQESDWGRRSELLLREQKSLVLVHEQKEQEVLESKLELTDEDRERVREKLSHANRNYYSLQYAESRDKLNLIQSKIRQLMKQINELDYSKDEVALQQRWNQNGMRLRYVFSVQEKNLELGIKEKQALMEETMDQVLAVKTEMASIVNDLGEKEKHLSAKEAEGRFKQEQKDQIAHAILSNPQLEKVELQIPLWMKEELQTEQNKIELYQEVKRLEVETERKEQRRIAVGEERAEAEKQLATVVEQLERQLLEQEDVKLELASLRQPWERLGSLYDKQASISEQMKESIERLRQQKNKLLMTERVAYRYVDDHGGQEIYFADIFVSKLCEQWNNQFSLLQLGTQYLNDVGPLGEGSERVDRLWAVTLITTEHEKDILRNKLKQAKVGYSYPIRILSMQEASDALQSKMSDHGDRENWVVPEHWHNNEKLDRFEIWKTELLEQAEQVRQKREAIEGEIARWMLVQQKWNTFLLQFPLNVQQELEHNKLLKQASVSELKHELEQLHYGLSVNRESMDSRRSTIRDMESRINQLGSWLQEGRKYMNLASEVAKLVQEIRSISEQIELLRKRKAHKVDVLQDVEVGVERVRLALADIQNLYLLIRRDECYIEVQNDVAEECNETLIDLKEERKVLGLQRNQIFQERTQLENSLTNEMEREKDHVRTMERLQTEHSDLVIDMPLPLEAEERKATWWADISHIKVQLSRLEDEYRRTEEEFQRKRGEIALLVRQFQEQYPGHDPNVFHEPQRTVKARLDEEEKTLRNEHIQLKKQQSYILEQHKQFDDVNSLWNKHLLVHALEDVKLTTAVLSEENQSEFRYKRKNYAESYIEQLSNCYEKLSVEKKLVQKGRQQLKEYFGSQVKDVKLRQMTLQGIDSKENYDEISEFQKLMEQRIQMAIHLWEQTLQTHDQELQQYIQHIHAHLKLIVQELKEIPKKTRVKTDDGWKEIYSFTIPQWEEQEGKERIRKHIDWIISKLDRYSEEQDHDHWQEQQTVIRKELEKWLDARQLIQIVMLGEGMKVTCRKVSNDQQVSRAAYSWEQTNRWSGGEKWSKNMTLFLGVLNYVAERKQYIQARMKRHRTVILDNPFGKASSDHVLSPVFFIAEQLGFQIIALTAHVEGKFLQDYFPIVYSCRLRHTVDPSKQIIEATQQIQTAYFQDNDPETLERIGSKVDQLELF